jgi:hypothetical protein
MSDDTTRAIAARRAAMASPGARQDAMRSIQGIRDPVSLGQLCPTCQDRGYVPQNGRQMPCHCPAGLRIVQRGVLTVTLTSMYGAQGAVLWLEERHPALGRERPLRLLGTDRAQEVFDIVTTNAVAMNVVPPEMPTPETARPVHERVNSALRATMHERIIVQLRTAGRHEGAALFAEDRVDDMNDQDRALLDSLTTGTGFLVDGQRVDPARVQVVRWR